MHMNARDVKGFNYHPGYSSCTFETWKYFDEEAWREELTLGKKYFPWFNAARIWLSWNAYCRDPEKFLESFEKALEILDSLGILAMPVLLNRWHDPLIDCDGVYLDHFVPRCGWMTKYADHPFGEYIDAVVSKYKEDRRIIAWDLCNEPFSYQPTFEWRDTFIPIEKKWLRGIYDRCKELGAIQPVSIGDAGNEYDLIDDISDIYFTHLYFRPEDPYDKKEIAAFDAYVKHFADEAAKRGKIIISNECGWGDFTDEGRVQRIKVTMEIFKKYNIGYTLYALCASGFPDLHDVEDGPLSPEIGNLCFINKDGKLRPGHDIVNEY